VPALAKPQLWMAVCLPNLAFDALRSLLRASHGRRGTGGWPNLRRRGQRP
jgi:hypothetical protein